MQAGLLDFQLHYRQVPLSDVFLECLISSTLARSCYSPAFEAGWLVGWLLGLFTDQSRAPQEDRRVSH